MHYIESLNNCQYVFSSFFYFLKKYALIQKRMCQGNHPLLRRVHIFVPLRSVHNKRHWRFAPLRSIFCMIERNFLSYKKKSGIPDSPHFSYLIFIFNFLYPTALSPCIRVPAPTLPSPRFQEEPRSLRDPPLSDTGNSPLCCEPN